MWLLSGGRQIVNRADRYSTFGMVDSWVWLAHAPQIYCFSPFLSVSSLLRIYTSNYWRIFERNATWVDIFCFYPCARLLLHCCSRLGSSNTHYSVYSMFILRYSATTNRRINCGPRGSLFKSRVGANILWGSIDCTRAYPSLHPFGVVHWVPVLSTATGCEPNRQLQLWTVFAGTVVNNYQLDGIQGWAGQLYVK